MADLEDIKSVNMDLPLTNFPDTIDEWESYSDADDEINFKILKYKNLVKQGESQKAEELYEQYSLKKYIIGANFLNKIQQMIIACERTISSVKKYFSFSTDAPDGTTAQPNGYIWGKILSTGNGFKKVLLKLKDNGTYVNIFPKTTADNVIISESDETTVKDKLEGLSENLSESLNTITSNTSTALDTKMNKENPTGSGALSINRNGSVPVGENSVAVGNNCSAQEKNSIAMGDTCQSLREGSITQGKGLVSNSPNQIVQGKYNSIGNYAYILGGGTSFSDAKNLFTVDWDGNAKAKTFTSEENIISNNDVIYNSNKSLLDLETTVDNNTFRLGLLETDMNSLGIRITGIQLYTSESEEIAYCEYANFSQFVTLRSGEQWLFIPRGMSESSGALDVGDVTGTGTTAQISFKLKNIDHVNKSAHKLKIAWYFITYKIA